jgi:hypothetical protein
VEIGSSERGSVTLFLNLSLEVAAVQASRKNGALAACPPAFPKLWQEMQLPTAIFCPFATSGSFPLFFGVKRPSDSRAA